MSPQDRQLLQDFLNQLTQVRGIVKDPEADAMIARAVAQQPDAAYLLVQRALLLDQALNNAKAEIAALQNQLRGTPQAAGGFLDPNAWGNSGTARPAAATPPAPLAPAPYQMPPQPAAAAAGPGFMRGGMGGMLGNIAATAAGVAGGAFLFQGIENLMGHHSGNGLLAQQNDAATQPNAFSSLTRPGEDTASNNLLGGSSQDGSDQASSDTSSELSSDPDSDFTDDSGSDDDLFA
ncbi:MAG: DUF2076 domain-containing protein [Massilia sp.]